MQHKTNLSSKTNLVPPLHFYISLSNSTPIDPEDLISIVTQLYKFSFWPAGWSSYYNFMDRWTLAQGAKVNQLAKQKQKNKKNVFNIVSNILVLCFTIMFSWEFECYWEIVYDLSKTDMYSILNMRITFSWQSFTQVLAEILTFAKLEA